MMRWWLCLLWIVFALPAGAQSAGELRAQARAVEIGDSPESQRRAIERLGELATAFIQLADKATLGGDAGAQAGELRAAYEAISTPLETIQKRAFDATEGQVQKIIAADGDLEALYESPAYREAQQTGAHALYFLNWLRYYGSRLYSGEQRQRLLEQAQAGFSELAAGDEQSELTVESLLGRGLCQLDAGKLDLAVQDLKLVADSSKASPERRDKARLALLEVYSKRGSTDAALKLSDEMLKNGGGPEADWVRYIRVQALLEAAKKAKGASGDAYRQEAMLQVDRLRRAGGSWEARVTALLASQVDNPEEWKKAGTPFAKWQLARLSVGKGDYAGAVPLLEEVVASNDKSLEANKPEANYYLGLAYFKAGRYADAASRLTLSLEGGKHDYSGDAAYLRFKAMEAQVAVSPQSVDPAAYQKSMEEFLAAYPEHKSALEARYRLGELYQAQEKFAPAIAEYAQVKGDPGFELQARFAVVQCEYELLAKAAGPERQQRLDAIDAGLKRFASDSAALDRKLAAALPMQQMQAKAALMRAVWLKLQPQPDARAILASLSGFEEKYKDESELLPQVVKLRMEACVELGDFKAASAELKAHGRLLVSQLDARALEAMAGGFIRAGARDKSQNDAAQQVALALYELMPIEGDASGRKALTQARLYENTGQPDKAAALYQKVLEANGSSLTALRGLARIAEGEKRLPQALEYWRKLAAQARPGDLPWYEANYEVARVSQLQGDKQGACRTLTELRPAMPGLSDAELRQKLTALYDQVCA